MRGGSQNFSIKAAANGDYLNNFGTGDIVCNREFFTMTEDRPIVKEVSLLNIADVFLFLCCSFLCIALSNVDMTCTAAVSNVCLFCNSHCIVN